MLRIWVTAQTPAEEISHFISCNVVGRSHLLQTPPHQYLCWSLPILFTQRLQTFLPKTLTPHERTVSLDDYSPLLAPLYNVGTCKPRLQLPLANTDLSALALAVLYFKFFDVRLELVEMVNAIIGDADGANESSAFCFDESEP